MEMVKNTSENIKTSLLLGSLIFLIVALAEVVLGAFKIYANAKELEEHWVNTIPFPPGIFPGLSILIVGLVWLAGYFICIRGQNAKGYLSVGIVIALGFILLFIVILLTDVFNAYALKLEDYEDWTALASLRWIIFLSPIPIFLAIKYEGFTVLRRRKEQLQQS